MITLTLLGPTIRNAGGTLSGFDRKIHQARAEGTDFITLNVEGFGLGRINLNHITAVFEASK